MEKWEAVMFPAVLTETFPFIIYFTFLLRSPSSTSSLAIVHIQKKCDLVELKFDHEYHLLVLFLFKRRMQLCYCYAKLCRFTIYLVKPIGKDHRIIVTRRFRILY